MSRARTLALAAATAFCMTGVAFAADKPADPKPAANRSCFFSRDWAGWRSPDENTIYLRVRIKDIYKVDLSSGSSLLMWPDSHLVNIMRGSDSVCSPLDLDLKVSQNNGFAIPLIVKDITKLTPEQVAAIPKKFLP